MSDLISRQAAIDALWKALYEYEDKTEKRFQESEELDVADWFQHRIFVQNMSDIDRRTLRDLPTIDAVPVKHGVWEKVKYEDDDGYFYLYVHKDCGCEQARERNYCPNCGARMDGRKDDETD